MSDSALEVKPPLEPHPHSHEIGILGEIFSLQNELGSLTGQIATLVSGNNYRFVSKRARNRILSMAVQRADEISETLKVLHRSLKKVRREKPSDEQVDLLFINDLTSAAVVTKAYADQDADES